MAQEAKLKFEVERDDILKTLPDELKDVFGAIGFCQGEDEDEEEGGAAGKPAAFIPCLIVSPFDVPPKPVRDIYWMNLYTKAKRSKAKLKKLDYLVYVYGSDDPDDCYNFVAHEDFVALEDGRSRGYDALPKSVSSKSESDRTETEAKLVRGLEEMKADLEKQPCDRKRGGPFLERWETLSQEESGLKEDKDEAPPPAKKQKA